MTELKTSAQYVEDKLDSIEEKSEHLLHGSRQIHDSLDSIGSHTKQVAQTAKNLEGHIDSVLTHSRSVYCYNCSMYSVREMQNATRGNALNRERTKILIFLKKIKC